MSDEELGESVPEVGTRPRWVRPAVALAAAALVGGVAITVSHMVSLNGGNTAGSATVGSTQSPGGSSGNVQQEKKVSSSDPVDIPKQESGPVSKSKSAESARATKAVDALISSMNQIGNRADGSSVGVESIATGFVLGEIQAFAQERQDLGYKQTGEAKITHLEASKVRLGGKTPKMTLTVCVDVSGIKVTDAAGNAMSTYNPGRPVKNVYGAEFVGGSWKISTHKIPNKQNCESKS